MTRSNQPSRRNLIVAGAVGAVALAGMPSPAAEPIEGVVKNGRINHSVCKWCYGKIPLKDFLPAIKKMGLKAVDLIEPKDFALLKEHEIACSMTSGIFGGIERGFNRREHHDRLVDTAKKLVDANVEHGFPNVICFSGNRGGLDDAEGIKVCAEGIKKVIGYFEEKKVNLIMELLNSRVNHADYQCDKSAWGIELCKAVGSERFKLLYDIYHMQIMEGDIIRSIQKNHEYFGHYHTGGNPGRNEIDETQEIYYPAVMQAIVNTKFTGYTAQEFIPKRPDALASLAQGVRICDV